MRLKDFMRKVSFVKEEWSTFLDQHNKYELKNLVQHTYFARALSLSRDLEIIGTLA